MKWMILLMLVGIAAAACATSPSDEAGRSVDPQKILSRTWQWETTVTPVEKIEVPAPERYTVFFETDGRVRVQFDCNRGGGGYEIAPGKLSFGPLISTRMACPPDSLDGPFIRDLERVTSFFVENGALYLELQYDSGTMRFRPKE